jgi:hypothetical protein
MPMDEKEAFDYYAKEENQVPAGPARRRTSSSGKSSHVPIRFLPETIAKVKVLAARERKTVSSWIRDLVEREVERRLPAPRSEAFAWPLRIVTSPHETSVTEAQGSLRDENASNLAAI